LREMAPERRFHVKHPDTEPELRRRMLERAAEAGLDGGAAADQRLMMAAEWLAKLAAVSGISGYDSPVEALKRGLMPALAYFAFAEAPRSGQAAELGAGAGALGAGIAILEGHLEVALVDRAKRSLTACELLAARLKLPNLAVVEMDLGLDGGARCVYDAVVFRALAPGGDALALARGVVRVGGFIAAYHREGDPAFAEAGENWAERGLERLRTVASGVAGLVVTGFQVRSADSAG